MDDNRHKKSLQGSSALSTLKVPEFLWKSAKTLSDWNCRTEVNGSLSHNFCASGPKLIDLVQCRLRIRVSETTDRAVYCSSSNAESCTSQLSWQRPADEHPKFQVRIHLPSRKIFVCRFSPESSSPGPPTGGASHHCNSIELPTARGLEKAQPKSFQQVAPVTQAIPIAYFEGWKISTAPVVENPGSTPGFV